MASRSSSRGQPCDQEAEPDEHEQPDDRAEEPAVECIGDLPHLGVHEQHDLEQEEEWEGPPQEPGHRAELADRLPERPAGERDEAVAGDEVDRAEEQEVDHRDRQTLRPLPADHGGPHARREHEDEHLWETHPGGAGEGPPTPQHVDAGPRAHDDPHRAEGGEDVLPPGEVGVQGAADLEEEHEGEDRQRPSEDVLGGAVALHEVRSASSHEPLLHRAQLLLGGGHGAIQLESRLADRGRPQAGLMFWLPWKRLVGSHSPLMAARRRYLSSP